MTKSKADATAETKAPLSHLPKQYRIIGAMGRLRGNTRKAFTRPMSDAHRNYESWRKSGFNGAWWWQYFKKSEAE
jgi:hypothetical protein